jgi:hypothetical protein
MLALRQALSSAITLTFMIASLILAVGLITSFFLKEIPLRKTHGRMDSAPPSVK